MRKYGRKMAYRKHGMRGVVEEKDEKSLAVEGRRVELEKATVVTKRNGEAIIKEVKGKKRCMAYIKKKQQISMTERNKSLLV